jgi:hypothetical protein
LPRGKGQGRRTHQNIGKPKTGKLNLRGKAQGFEDQYFSIIKVEIVESNPT